MIDSVQLTEGAKFVLSVGVASMLFVIACCACMILATGIKQLRED